MFQTNQLSQLTEDLQAIELGESGDLLKGGGLQEGAASGALPGSIGESESLM